MNKKDKLIKLKEKMLKDTSLPLRKKANNLVFGEGRADSEVMFIGEGPGYWEDQKGRPFVGRAGAFLNQMLSLIKLERKDVFITNIIHYRPPDNRDPKPEEIESFRPYLDKMIDIIDPKIIVTLGRFSMAKFIPGVYITNVHGKSKEVSWKGKDLTVIPMYHPAAGLRNGEIKRRTIEDFKFIPEVLENKKKTKKTKVQKIKQMNLI